MDLCGHETREVNCVGDASARTRKVFRASEQRDSRFTRHADMLTQLIKRDLWVRTVVD